MSNKFGFVKMYKEVIEKSVLMKGTLYFEDLHRKDIVRFY